MNQGNFYFIKDNYFQDFQDDNLMLNSEIFNGIEHNRPCYFAFLDPSTSLFWMIPISSQVDKYKQVYRRKIEKYGKCDTIAFAKVLGHEKAFLIQNMCPVTINYIQNEYIDQKASIPVRIDYSFEKELVAKAKRILALQRKGYSLIFPNVLQIEKSLINV